MTADNKETPAQTINAQIYPCDPRVRLAAVLAISTLSVIFADAIWLAGLFAVSLLVAAIFHAPVATFVRQFRWLIPMFFMLCLAQSLFDATGSKVLLGIGAVHILTLHGLTAAALFSFRILIVVSSAMILLPESSRRMLQALSQMHLPYELVFMVATAIRFLAIIRDEFRNSLHAIELRGVVWKSIPAKQRTKVYSYLLLPVISNTLQRARELSLSIELRGFRRSNSRTSYFTLVLNRRDKLLLALIAVLFAAVLAIYFII